MYTLIYKAEARKTLVKLPRNLRTSLHDKLLALAANPFAANNNVKKLTGREGYRLRVGDWRIIYSINQDILQILVLKIAPRGEVYK